jgi:hypothetical protein
VKAPTPFDTALVGFDVAMRAAEKHRRELKQRFGFTDQQIGLAVLARRNPGGPYRQLAKATLAAKLRMKDAAGRKPS